MKRLLGFVQYLHVPVGVFLQARTNAPYKVTANIDQLLPSRRSILDVKCRIRGSEILPMLNSKIISRHLGHPANRPPKAAEFQDITRLPEPTLVKGKT
jgi:hypothetical protein